MLSLEGVCPVSPLERERAVLKEQGSLTVQLLPHRYLYCDTRRHLIEAKPMGLPSVGLSASKL